MQVLSKGNANKGFLVHPFERYFDLPDILQYNLCIQKLKEPQIKLSASCCAPAEL